MGNHLLGQPTGPPVVPGSSTTASSAGGGPAPAPPQQSTTVAGDQLAAPPGPGQTPSQSMNPADGPRSKMQMPAQAKVPNAPSTIGGFKGGVRRVGV